ncbi:hypothetical protein D3C71_1982960 [compost metagenome]
MFRRTGNDGDGTDGFFQPADRSHHLELHQRNAVAIAVKRQAFEHDIGQPAKGGCIACALFCLDQRIR